MAQRLMTPFCFASRLAAALIAEGAVAQIQPKAPPLRAGFDAWILPFEAVGGLEIEDGETPPAGAFHFA